MGLWRTTIRTAVKRSTFFAGLVAAAPDCVIAAAGGVIVMQNSATLGAVGVPGDTSHNDKITALAGIVAAGLTMQ